MVDTIANNTQTEHELSELTTGDIPSLVDIDAIFMNENGAPIYHETDVYEGPYLDVTSVPSAEVPMYRLDFFYNHDQLQETSLTERMKALFDDAANFITQVQLGEIDKPKFLIGRTNLAQAKFAVKRLGFEYGPEAEADIKVLKSWAGQEDLSTAGDQKEDLPVLMQEVGALFGEDLSGEIDFEDDADAHAYLTEYVLGRFDEYADEDQQTAIVNIVKKHYAQNAIKHTPKNSDMQLAYQERLSETLENLGVYDYPDAEIVVMADYDTSAAAAMQHMKKAEELGKRLVSSAS